MAPEAEVCLLYVQDSEPGFMWAGGRVIPAAEADRRQLIFGILGRAVQKALIDRQTPVGRVVWGHASLIIEAPLQGTDRSGRLLTLTMAVLGRIRAVDWHDSAVALAETQLASHGLETDRPALEAVLREAQRLRPGFLLGWWLDLWHSIIHARDLAVSRLAGRSARKGPGNPASGQETIDEAP
jgi:hypothetical protein